MTDHNTLTARTGGTTDGREIMTLHAERMDGRLVVVDPEGGVWWPSKDAAAEIEAAEDPAQAAIEMCQAAPMRGVWKQ